MIVPCELSDANAFVDAVHRHHKPVRGHRWSLAVLDESAVTRGVATIGRPVGRQIDQRKIVEVLRVATDGCPNACSALYGASCRQQRSHGYAWAQTYTLLSEPGTSLRAAGWKPVHITKHEPKGWGRSDRPRDVERHPTERKVRWECPCSPNPAIACHRSSEKLLSEVVRGWPRALVQWGGHAAAHDRACTHCDCPVAWHEAKFMEADNVYGCRCGCYVSVGSDGVLLRANEATQQRDIGATHSGSQPKGEQ